MTARLGDRPLTAAEVLAVLADARTWPRCPGCDGLHLDPFVDVNPARIPRDDARAQDRIDLFLNRQAVTVLPNTQLRIACPTPAVAKNTAALLRGLGAPAWAIYLGGF
ncbi:MAG: hypothetical protein HOY79_17465 [Streptomyces sp.]|nr:hypothetical protein [Streptomyces sp.]